MINEFIHFSNPRFPSFPMSFHCKPALRDFGGYSVRCVCVSLVRLWLIFSMLLCDLGGLSNSELRRRETGLRLLLTDDATDQAWLTFFEVKVKPYSGSETYRIKQHVYKGWVPAWDSQLDELIHNSKAC